MRFAFDATALPPGPPDRANAVSAVAGNTDIGVSLVPTGAGRYIVRLVQALGRLPIEGRLYVFAKTGDVDRLGPWPPQVEPVPVRLPSRPARLAWEQTGLPLALRRLDVDLLHSPHYTLPLNAGRTARVVTVPDMIFFLLPQHHQPVKRWFFRPMIRAAVRLADHILAPSESTRADACRLLTVAPERITVVHAAADECFRPIDEPRQRAAIEEKYGLRHPLLLTVGTLEPRKNLAAAVRTLASARAAGFDCQLAVAGARGWRYRSLFDEIDRLGVARHVRFLGYVPDADLPVLYSLCDVFLYPSLYEGFGLPPLEAMACGATVIVTNRSSLPEVVGEGGLQYDPDDEKALAELVRDVLNDEAGRHRRRRRAVERAARFTWERAAQETYESYRRVLARKRG